jgi:hypothetical protein
VRVGEGGAHGQLGAHTVWARSTQKMSHSPPTQQSGSLSQTQF